MGRYSGPAHKSERLGWGWGSRVFKRSTSRFKRRSPTLFEPNLIGFLLKVRKAIPWQTIRGVDVVADAVANFCFSYYFGPSFGKILTTPEQDFGLFPQ